MKSKIKLQTAEISEYIVDWDELPDEAKFVAINFNSGVYWYSEKPRKNYSWWIANNSCQFEFLEYLNAETVDNWQETLVERPARKFKETVKAATSEITKYGEDDIEIGSLWTPDEDTYIYYNRTDVYMLSRADDGFVAVKVYRENGSGIGTCWKLKCDTKEEAIKGLVPFHGEVTLKG